MKRNTVVVLLILILSFPWAAQSQEKTKSAVTEATPPANDTTYVIGPEDVLTIDVWNEKELSGPVPVRPDGKISVPLLNDVQAAGLTPMQLMSSLTEKLKKYVADPTVTVTVTTVNSRKVYILGEVTRPGAFALVPDMTVLQALTTAGGPTPYAKTSKIYILRSQNGVQNKLAFNYKQVVRGGSPEQNILLKSGDTVVVP
jgi:polysaccharide export outer membrane protein